MPDTAVLLEQKPPVHRAIAAKFPEMPECPLCHSKSWAADEALLPLPLMQTATLAAPGQRVIYAVPLTCLTCGFTALLNTGVLGLKVSLPVGGGPRVGR